MGRTLLAGAAAGAAGTTALNAVSYLDMLVRGRGASSVPERTASRITGAVGIDLGEGEAAGNRGSALGALLGTAVGVGVGLTYAAVRGAVAGSRRVPLAAAAAGVGALAMAASDVPSAALGVTKLSTWGAAGWLSDIVPHAAYGAVTVATYEALAGARRGRRRWCRR